MAYASGFGKSTPLISPPKAHDMRIQPIIAACCLLLLTCPIAALAADAGAPTAPAVQSAVWTIEDYLKAGFSGAAGGLLSSFMALVGIWLRNKNAEKINKQKIDADKESIEKSYKHQIERICYEEKRKICLDFLSEIDFIKLMTGKLRIENAVLLSIKINITCDQTYSNYISYIMRLITQDRILRKSDPSYKILSQSTDEIAEFMQRASLYSKFYRSIVVITRKMLAGEELLPATEWNLDDFEGSVPLDYRKLIS